MDKMWQMCWVMNKNDNKNTRTGHVQNLRIKKPANFTCRMIWGALQCRVTTGLLKSRPKKPNSEMVPVQFTESGQDATNMLGHDEQKMPGQGIFTKCRHRKWPRHKILAVKKHWTNFLPQQRATKEIIWGTLPCMVPVQLRRQPPKNCQDLRAS